MPAVRFCLLPAVLVLAACENIPPPLQLPEQRRPLPEFRSYRIEHMVDFSQSDMARVVSDILPPAGGWSWSGKRPAVKIAIRGARPARMRVEFSVADATFRSTGPLAVTFFVNDHVLATIPYTAPGRQTFEKLVPAEWLQADNVVGAEVDKVWTSPDDGARLGLILHRMGLIEE